MLDVSCPSCGETYHVAEEHVGRSLRCRRCGNVFEIRAPRTAPGAASAAASTSATTPAGRSTASTSASSPGAGNGKAAGHPVEVTDRDFEQLVLRSPQPVVVDFWAPWCPPCRALAPAVEQLAAEYGGRVTFAKLNTDDNPRTMSRYGVMGLPTLVLFKGGREVQRLVGLQPKPAIKRAVDLAIAA
jgi:thioredoxin 1